MQPNIQATLLWRAFNFILTTGLTDDGARKRVLGDQDARLKALSPRWQAALEPKIQQIVIGCATSVRGAFPTVCDEAYAETADIQINLTDNDYQVLLNSNPAVAGYVKTPAGGTYKYLADQFVSQSKTFMGFKAIWAQGYDQVVVIIDNCVKLDGYIGMKLADQEKNYNGCLATITSVQVRVANLSGEAILGPSLQPLVMYCTGFLNEKLKIINLCTKDRLSSRCDALTFSFVDFKADVDLITPLSFPMYQACCLDVPPDCNGLLDGIQPTVFDGLRKVLVTGALQKSFGVLLTDLGGPGFFALSSLSSADTGKLLTRWIDLRGDFLTKCPPGSAEDEILPYFSLACTGASVKDGWIAISQGTTPRINLPVNCQTFGMMLINGILMPRAFSLGGYRTDDACMKHCKQELGVAPSKAKMEAYFAELAQACGQAAQVWSQKGKPDMYPAKVQCAVAEWHINVGSNGDKIVHHIDSGYQNSPWIGKQV